MVTVKTVRVRPEWVEGLRKRYGTDQAIADAMGVNKSTASRWLRGDGEAPHRFIGTALLTWAIEFDDAFMAIEEIAERRRARTYTHATGRPAAA